MTQLPNHNEDPRIAQILDVIFKLAAGDLSARGTLSERDDALDGVMAGINILAEELGSYIADNKRTQEALQQALEYAKTLIRSSPDGILAVDLDLRITEWSLLMEQICGKSREEAIGRKLDEIPFMAKTGEAARIRLAFAGKPIDTRELGYRFPGTDKDRFFESLMTPLPGPAGQTMGAVLRLREITGRRQALQALTGSEAMLRAIFDSIQDGIILAEAESLKFLRVNAAICRMLGYSPEELIDVGVNGIHPKDDIERVVGQIGQLARGEISVMSNVPMRRKDGSIFYADVSTGSMTFNGAACLVGVFRDITERQRAQQALTDSETLLRAVFDAAQDGILLAEAPTGRFRMANDSICRMLGYNHDELLELSVENIHPEQDLPNVRRQIERQLKREITLASNLPVKRKDGTVFYADINSTPMEVEGVPFILGVFKDITERKRAEQAEELASRDSLTNLYNHRTFYSLLKDEVARARRFNRPVSLLMLDIDHFKLVNDSHGHQVGDTILKGLSELLLKDARAVDRVCRYGGEEFTLILPETDAAVAIQIAERLRAAVEHHPFPVGCGKTIDITVSIGAATHPPQEIPLKDFVKAADLGLYDAKQGGRNRVCSHEIEQAHQDD
jgi:diguanylate cyclase (GGDEF)-like protein/PAS domain S-box-containing protein